MVTDPISDMFTRIKNAQAVGQKTVELPFSKFKFELAKILKKEGYIEEATKHGRKAKKILEVALKYRNKTPQISEIKRISKSSRRLYVSSKDLKSVRQGFGTAVISTSKGLMTSKEARKQKLGGEVICEIW